MNRNLKFLYAFTGALAFCGVIAGAVPAQAALKCECLDFDKCVVQKGRADVPFSYDPNNMGGAYDALEAKAMKDADDKAATDGEAARQTWEAKGVQCPQPCDPTPEFWTKHGPPFAGAGGTRPGYGEGRSVWKVSYICKKTPPPPPPPPKKHHGGLLGLFFGFNGIGIEIGTGGYCDHWGCPGNYWDDPVFYGPVYFDGEWYEGPVYYREHHGHYEYWVHGDWHEDEWQGDRPDWARDTYYGDALGRDYYQSDDFHHWKDRHKEGDWGQHDKDHNQHFKDDHGGKNDQGKGDQWEKGDKGGNGDQGKNDQWRKGDKGGNGDKGDKGKDDKKKGDKNKDNPWPH